MTRPLLQFYKEDNKIILDFTGTGKPRRKSIKETNYFEKNGSPWSPLATSEYLKPEERSGGFKSARTRIRREWMANVTMWDNDFPGTCSE